MTNMTGSKLSIFSHPGKITVIGLLQDHFHIEAHIGLGQYGPRHRLGPNMGVSFLDVGSM
jgi:hypothetical protein